MFKSVERCLSFYKMLKKDKAFEWSEYCEKAIVKLKNYLSSPLILIQPEDEETLFLYITMLDEAMGTIIIMKRDGKQMIVYYTSKVLHGIEVKY